MERFLDITPGSVSVLGLMNDREHRVSLLVDEDVLNAEYLGCHPCINTSSLRVRVDDIFTTFLNEVSHDYKTVHVEVLLINNYQQFIWGNDKRF